MEHICVKEASKKWGISPRRVQSLCAQGRVVGAERLGNAWAIPTTAQKPLNIRIKSEKKGLFIQLQEQLKCCTKESELSPFLKEHSLLIQNALNVHAWNCVVCEPEFRLGSDYVADFIILSADSGSWHAVLIEVQDHQNKIYNQNGNMTQQLNEGHRQIHDWNIWINEHPVEFRQSISKLVSSEPAQCSRVDVHTNAGAEIRDIKTVISTTFKILIGRREFLNQTNNKRRSEFRDANIEIVTFDRLLDKAKQLDENKQYLID